MKNKVKAIAIVLAMSMLLLCFAACTAVQVAGSLVINEDGSGSRQLTGLIAKQDYQDGYGSAYYYFKLHGADLQAKIESIYADKVPGSSDWLKVSVDDSGDVWEVITISFDFTSLEDYTAKLKSLAYDETFTAAYADPTFVWNEDGTYTYTESGEVMKAFFKSLQMSIMADETAYDPTCTKDGTPLNDGSADGQLEEYGVEMIKPENGEALTLQVNGGDVVSVPNVEGTYTYTGTVSGEPVVEDHETTCVLHYGFDDALTNAGTAGAEHDLTYGIGSTAGGPVYEAGLVGNAIKLDGATYLASPNKTYTYKEMTISFYYRMDAYTETDTGANMIIVPAGLGALGAGVIDVEFIKDSGANGIQLLGKMNSADWQTQDKLYSEEYLVDNRLNQWHHYTLVYSNEYDDAGEIVDAFVYMYIDGKLATRSRLSVAAGLPFSLGSYDDGSFGDPNGGFNVGGYYEAEIVKRACTGAIDELMVFDGALTEEEINTLCYTVKVDNAYDPDAPEVTPPAATDPTTPAATTPTQTEPETPSNNTALIVVIVLVAVAAIAAVAVMVLRKKKA